MAQITPTTTAVPANIPVSAIGNDGSVSNETALAIVKADVQAAEGYMSEKAWQLRWREIDNLYQSPRPMSVWEGTSTTEANVQAFTVAKYTNSIVPTVLNGIFYQAPFFILRPNPSITEEIIRQKTVIFSTLFREMDFESTCEDIWFSTVLFGTGIAKRGQCNTTKTKTAYRRKGNASVKPGKYADVKLKTKKSTEYDVVETDEDFWCPEFHHIPNEECLVDPALEVSDIRKAKFVAHVKYMTGYDLIEMCKEHDGEEGWYMPSIETIRSWFDTPLEQTKPPSAPETNLSNTTVVAHARSRDWNVTGGDPLMRVLKVVEHWTNKRVTLMVQDKLIVRNGKNPWGKLPFYSSHWWKIPRSFWSLGVGQLVGQDQRVQQGIRNAALNLLAMAVNPVLLRKAGDNQPGQNIRLRRGAIITVTGEGKLSDNFGILPLPEPPQQLMQWLQNSNNESEQTSGADGQLVQGTMGGSGKSSMGRTAGGAMQLAAASASRLQGPVSRFVNNLLKPFIFDMDAMCNEELSEEQAESILGEELGKEYTESESFDYEKYLNGKAKFEILAAQHLAAKRAMAQILPLMMQLFENQQLIGQLSKTGWTIDVLELVRMFFEVSEFTNSYDVVRRLTPQEEQYQANSEQQNPAMAKAKAQIAVDNNKAQNQSDLQAENNDNKAIQIVERHMVENFIQPATLSGEWGGENTP